MRKLFIHIGTEKTGTTTLQKFLLLNRELLKENNFYIPEVYYDGLNHRYITSFCQKKIDDFLLKLNIFNEKQKKLFVEKTKKLFYEEFSKLSNDVNVIISSEHFHSRYKTVEEIKCIKNLFKDLFDEINIVVYLRNQVDMLQSYYSTALKGGMYYKSIDDFINQELKGNRNYYDYNNLLSLWSVVFGEENLKVRIVDKKEFIDNNLINDFLYTISPTLYENIKNIYKIPSNLNESINNEGELLLKLINKNLKFKNLDMNSYLEDINRRVSNNCKGKLHLLDKNMATIIINEFKESNEMVRKKYFKDKENLFEIDLNKYKKIEPNIPKCVVKSFEDLILEYKKIIVKNAELFDNVKHEKVLFLDGWYNKEKWGIWAKGDEVSKLLILLPKKLYEFTNGLKIKFKLKKSNPDLKVYPIYNNKKYELKKNEYELILSKEELNKKGGHLFIEFKHENAKSPKELGINKDTRILGVGIEDISFEEIL